MRKPTIIGFIPNKQVEKKTGKGKKKETVEENTSISEVVKAEEIVSEEQK